MPEGWKIRSDSDYIFHLSGISRLERDGANKQETPAQKTAGVTRWGTHRRRAPATLATARVQRR